jgi:Na+:H+ antiporter, NhaC family
VTAFAADPMLDHRLALLKGVWAALATGYEAQTGEPALDQLLSPDRAYERNDVLT